MELLVISKGNNGKYERGKLYQNVIVTVDWMVMGR